MGYEQRIRLGTPRADELDALLRSLPGFEGYDAKYGLYNFRRRGQDAMPDAHAAIEAEGIYFCDNGIGSRFSKIS